MTSLPTGSLVLYWTLTDDVNVIGLDVSGRLRMSGFTGFSVRVGFTGLSSWASSSRFWSSDPKEADRKVFRRLRDPKSGVADPESGFPVGRSDGTDLGRVRLEPIRFSLEPEWMIFPKLFSGDPFFETIFLVWVKFSEEIRMIPVVQFSGTGAGIIRSLKNSCLEWKLKSS